MALGNGQRDGETDISMDGPVKAQSHPLQGGNESTRQRQMCG